MRRGVGIGALAGLDYVPKAVPTEANAKLLRGVVWSCAIHDSEHLAAVVAIAARECSRKLPDVGARSPKVFNACLLALAEMPDQVGAQRLLALQQKARKPSARKRVDAAVDRLAETAGISPEALADSAVPTHGLEDGPVTVEAGSARCELSVEPPGRVIQVWRSSAGEVLRRPPRTVPKAVAEVRVTLATRRGRLERALASGAQWPWARFRDSVLAHPITSSISSSLVIEIDGSWMPAVGPPRGEPADDARVRLWHPAGKSIEDVVAWRERLARARVVQPFKQAHREEADVSTASLDTFGGPSRATGRSP
jgi:hypothetical protein